MKNLGKIVFSFVVIWLGGNISAQSNFYNIDSLQKIELYFSQPNWDYQMDTSKLGAEGYIMADWVKVNGVQFDSVGVKYKGNSSYDSSVIKNPIHIALDEYINQSYENYTDIKLGNGYSDPSMIREVLSYDILGNYMDCPKANFAQLYINGTYFGLYSNAESINKKFCSDHFYSSQNTFIKCNPNITPGPNTKCNLKYINSDSSSYFNFYELKSATTDWSKLVDLCDTVTNNPSGLPNMMDVDRAIWMLAFNNVLVNLDSYTGAFVQNYYLYEDNTGHFNPVIWDLNMSFGGFPFVGSGMSSLGSLTVTNMQQLSPSIHSADVYWPLINDIYNNPMYKKMYIAHMKTIVDEFFANNAYQTMATQLQTVADTAVQSDLNKFFSYTQFQNAMTTNIVVGSYTVPGITNLMGARVTYLQSTADFQNSAPVITSVNPSSSLPALSSLVYITANVTNTNSNAVYLGYRNSLTQKFQRVLMYDDGAHGDGASGDNVYGASFTMSSSVVQYYIYAENNNAGMFSPVRAEHEFYTLYADIQLPVVGQIFINEFLAINQTDITDENNQHEDWIEIFNVTDQPLNLYGLYLTDTYTNLTKFEIPAGTVLDPHGFMIVWADEDASTTQSLHANFKLAATGEQIILSDGNSVIYDSTSFGAQTADISMGRCTDGFGPFQVMSVTTFLNYNCPVGIPENSDNNIKIDIYPVPANEMINVLFSENASGNFFILNSLGEIIYQSDIETHSIINTQSWSPGLYVFRSGDYSKKFIITHP